MTTQTFDLGSMPGSKMIVTDGYEYADFNRPFRRAVTGGTGRYRNARGEQVPVNSYGKQEIKCRPGQQHGNTRGNWALVKRAPVILGCN